MNTRGPFQREIQLFCTAALGLNLRRGLSLANKHLGMSRDKTLVEIHLFLGKHLEREACVLEHSHKTRETDDLSISPTCFVCF